MAEQRPNWARLIPDLIVLGLLPLVDTPVDALKLVTIWLLVLLSGADASQLIARAARRVMRRTR